MLLLLPAKCSKEFTLPHHQYQQIPLEEPISKFTIQLFTQVEVLLSQMKNIKLPNKNKENSTQPVKEITQLPMSIMVSNKPLEIKLETKNSFN